MIDAIIRTGGKQYRVHEGSILNVATIDAETGSRLELRDVLMLSDGDKITVGSPLVADAVVVAEVLEHGRGRKVINFKYKAKARYRRKRGHRQGFTRISVQEILPSGVSAGASATRSRRSAPASEATPDETPAEETATPARRARRTRAAEAASTTETTQE